MTVKNNNQEIHNAFIKADENKSGYISYINFRKVLRSLNIYLSSKEIDAILNIIDTTSSG